MAKLDPNEDLTPVPLAERTAGDHVTGTHGSQCNDCAYRWANGRACDAFPAGIPIKVRTDRVIHNRPLPELGQNNDLVKKRKWEAQDFLDEMR